MTSEVISDYLASSRDSAMSDLATQLDQIMQDEPATLPPHEPVSTPTPITNESHVRPTTETTLPMLPPMPEPSIAGLSTQSVRTSSYAMSDLEDSNLPQLESLRIRKMYSVRTPRSRMSDVTRASEMVDYFDEKNFENTDRYGFIRVQSSNSDPPEKRNQSATNGNSKPSSSLSKHKLLAKKKKDILMQPRMNESEMTAREIARAKKWRDMAVVERSTGEIHYRFPITKKVIIFRCQLTKMIQRTFKGIPDCWRTQVWYEFLDHHAAMNGGESEQELIQTYYYLLDQDCEDDAQIDLDVPRTISEHIFFHQRYGAGQRLLFQVLHCISLKFPDYGYVQGMAPIAATLLCYFPDELTFVMLVRLWQDKGLKNFFSRQFDGLMNAFKSLEEELKHRPVGRKLTSLGIDPSSYATRWYLTLFSYSLPFHTQLRIWDVLMISSNGPAMLHAAGLALLNGLADRLKHADFEKAMNLITTRIDVKNDDKLMHLVLKEAIANGALRFE